MEKNIDGGGLSVTLIINNFVSWWTTFGPNFNKFESYLGKKGSRNPPKRAHFMAAASPQNNLKIYNFGTTNGMKMKLTTIMYLNETYHSEKNWGAPTGRRRAWPKNLCKKAKKTVFWFLLFYFWGLYKKFCYRWYLAMHCITGPNFKRMQHHLGELYSKHHPKAA